MSDFSAIEWTDATWNPVMGCTKVSQGCKNCYAERLWPKVEGARVALEGGEPRPFTHVSMLPHRLDTPLHWRKPRRILVNSMSDLFHEDVSIEFIGSVLGIAAACEWHIFQVLTKRPQRMRAVLSSLEFQNVFEESNDLHSHTERLWPPNNVWLGVSVEDQATADERIPLLLQTPAAVRWISAEPLLGTINLARWIEPTLRCGACGEQYSVSEAIPDPEGHPMGADKCARCGHENVMFTDWGEEAATQGCPDDLPGDQWDHGYKLHWVVAGGESGPKARPSHPDWFRSLRDQCQAADVPFFFKQWGEWVSVSEVEGKGEHHHFDDGATVRRVGKKAAGRQLDGREWNEYPQWTQAE